TSEQDAKNCSHAEFLGFGSVSPNYNKRMQATPLDYVQEPSKEESKEETPTNPESHKGDENV
ncbi:NADH-quinone oxidoreductase subunit NuoI, partial [Helicobacter pylori]|nr:NADH-quinone oxidoreductase subunit NuoI [Helicobacter pylori]